MKKRISRALLFVLILNLLIPQLALAEKIYKDEENISAWALEYVIEASDKKIVSDHDGYFNPKNNITRGEFTKLIVEALDLERDNKKEVRFSDVKESDWFYDYVTIAASNGIIEGANGKFNPKGNIKREEMAVIISRALGLEKLEDKTRIKLEDKNEIASWALEDVCKMVEKGIIQGSDNKFNPKGKVTREMATVVVMRTYDFEKSSLVEEDKPEEIKEFSVEKELDSLVNYIRKTVTEPTVASIGGEWSVLGLNRANRYDTKDFNEKYLKNLKKILKEKDGELHRARYTEYSRVVLALNSMDKNPKDIFTYNLEKEILDMDNITKQGINGPIFALIALNSKDDSMTDEKKAMVDYILAREIDSGGWALSKDAAKGDIDVTAMTIQALAAYVEEEKDIRSAVERGVEFLSKEQDKDGGYTSWGSKNSENVSQVVIGLSMLGIDSHKDERFIKEGNSLIDFLLSYQGDKGGFNHEKNGEVNLMASEQALLALVSYERYLEGDQSLYDMSK